MTEQKGMWLALLTDPWSLEISPGLQGFLRGYLVGIAFQGGVGPDPTI